jgi:hypothetical protein
MDGDGFKDKNCGGDDCEDTEPEINPDAQERCRNNVDDNCDDLKDCQDSNCLLFSGFCDGCKPGSGMQSLCSFQGLRVDPVRCDKCLEGSPGIKDGSPIVIDILAPLKSDLLYAQKVRASSSLSELEALFVKALSRIYCVTVNLSFFDRD